MMKYRSIFVLSILLIFIIAATHAAKDEANR